MSTTQKRPWDPPIITPTKSHNGWNAVALLAIGVACVLCAYFFYLAHQPHVQPSPQARTGTFIADPNRPYYDAWRGQWLGAKDTA